MRQLIIFDGFFYNIIMKKITKTAVMKKLSSVIDPELNISIVDLGLVYDVQIIHNSIKIIMTLTTIGCPLFFIIESDVKNKMKEIGFQENEIKIELTFDPPWSLERLSPAAKATLGL